VYCVQYLTMSDNGSTAGFDIHTPILNERELLILDECDTFANTVLNITRELRQNGHSEIPIPRFPKSDLLAILGRSKPQKVLRGMELHLYLMNKLTAFNTEGFDLPPPATDIPRATISLNRLLPDLQRGYIILKNINAKLIGASLTYGLWLNLAYEVFEFDKGAGLVKGSWSNWLKENVNVSDSYGRQLCDLSTRFGSYDKMYYLSIPFSEMWSRRFEISQLINSDNNIEQFWKNI